MDHDSLKLSEQKQTIREIEEDERDKRVQRKRALVLVLVYMLSIFGPVVMYYKYRVPLVNNMKPVDYSQNILMNR